MLFFLITLFHLHLWTYACTCEDGTTELLHQTVLFPFSYLRRDERVQSERVVGHVGGGSSCELPGRGERV